MRSIEQSLAAFNVRDLQTFRTIIQALEIDGYQITDALKYINWRTGGHRFRMKYCSECSAQMVLLEVNTTRCTKVGEKFRTQWFCNECGHSEFSRRTIPQIMARLKSTGTEPDEDVLKWEIDRYLKEGVPSECPQCHRTMRLYPVTVPEGKSNIHGYKSLWSCGHCGYEDFSTKTMVEQATKLRRI